MKSKTKTKKGFNPKTYYESLHLGKLFEEFAFATNKNGTVKYKTVHQFCTSHTKTDKEYEVLYWLIGPKIDVDPETQVARFDLPQFDWIERRENGHWNSTKNQYNLKKHIESKTSVMDKLSATGSVNLDTLTLLQNLQEQLNKEFGTQIFLPDASAKENKERAELYLSLTTHIAKLQADVQTQFAKVNGIDVNNLSAVLQLFSTAMQTSIVGDHRSAAITEDSGKSSLAQSFMDMMMKKSVSYNLEPPDEIKHHFNEEPEVIVPKKKHKVQ